MPRSATRGETLSPNPNECNSTLTSGTNNIFPVEMLMIVVTGSDRGHLLRITHTWWRHQGPDPVKLMSERTSC